MIYGTNQIESRATECVFQLKINQALVQITHCPDRIKFYPGIYTKAQACQFPLMKGQIKLRIANLAAADPAIFMRKNEYLNKIKIK